MQMVHWLTAEGWRYDVYPIDVDPADISRFSSIVSLWQNKFDGPRLPAWRDFELMDLKDWWGMLAVYDVLQRNALDVRCRLWGTLLVTFHGVDMTNARLRDPASGMYGDSEMFDHIDVEFMEVLLDGPQIGTCEGRVKWHNRDFLMCHLVRLPLADDGVTPDKLLCAFDIY